MVGSVAAPTQFFLFTILTQPATSSERWPTNLRPTLHKVRERITIIGPERLVNSGNLSKSSDLSLVLSFLPKNVDAAELKLPAIKVDEEIFCLPHFASLSTSFLVRLLSTI